VPAPASPAASPLIVIRSMDRRNSRPAGQPQARGDLAAAVAVVTSAGQTEDEQRLPARPAVYPAAHVMLDPEMLPSSGARQTHEASGSA